MAESSHPHSATAEDPVVVQLRDDLAGCRTLHGYLDSVAIMAARYQVGQHWRSGMGAQAGVVIPPKVTRENPIVTANIVGAHVRQATARLAVHDFSAWYEPRDIRPEVHLTARQLQSWYNYWIRESNLEPWHNDLSFGCAVTGSTIGTWYFNEDKPGGVGLANLHPGRLTIDPSNRSWELDDHEKVVQSDALSSEEARRRYRRYFDDDRPFDSDCRLSQLRSVESYVGSALYGIQPGAGESRTTGVIVHRRFYDNFGRMQIIVENPSPAWKTEKEKSPEYYIAGDWKWRWGCPYLKLDYHRNIAMAFGNGLVVELVPMQNLINLALRSNLGALLSRASYYLTAYNGTIVNKSALNGPAGSVIWLKPKALKEKLTPQFIAPPRYDTAADGMMQQAHALLAQMSHITPTLQGYAKTGREPYAHIELLRQMGLAPLAEIAATHKTRTEQFLNRAARAALDHYGRTKPEYLANIVGRSLGNRKLGQVASKTILAGPTACVLRDDAFLAQTADEKAAVLDTAMMGGHMQWERWAHERYKQTGYPVTSDQAASYQQCQELVRRILQNEPDGDFVIDDNLDVALWCIGDVMNHRITLELKREQIARLQTAKTQVLYLKSVKGQAEAALAGLSTALAGPGEQLEPTAPGAPGAPGMQGGAAPELVGSTPEGAV